MSQLNRTRNSKTFNVAQYATNEIELAKAALSRNPEDVVQRDRLAYWLARTGDFTASEKIECSDKVKTIVAEFKKG